MNLVRISAVLPLNAFAVSFRATWLVVLGTFLLAAVMQAQTYAITLNISYFNEGDPLPHDENPNWDIDGTILKSHFQAAKTIWENLLPGGGSYDIEFEWDNDIDPLGLTSPDFTDPSSWVIEMNTDSSWYADADFTTDNDFSFLQTLYPGLSAANRTAWFPGTAPPAALEVGYVGTGNGAASLQQGVTSANGFDLLTVILHEIGHTLGFSGTEPGEYNIDPQHVGGVNNVLVKEAEDDTILFESHLAGSGTAPWLMDGATIAGQRTLPTATDILVIAEDQGIDDVHLARVGRISSGLWSDSNAWIGADAPDATQDVYVSHGGTVTVDVAAQANNVLIAPGNGLEIQTSQALFAVGTLTFTDGTLTIGPGGLIFANTLIGRPDSITSAAGSLVRFNQFTETTATLANFGGSVAIGFDTDFGMPLIPVTTTVNPTSATWNIAENLIVGDENYANLIVDNGVWTVNGNATIGRFISAPGTGFAGSVTLQTNAVMTVGGNVKVEGPGAAVIVEGTATLGITGNVTIGKGGRFTYRVARSAASRPYSIAGGEAVNIEGQLYYGSGGSLTFEDASNAADATITLDGGAGDSAPGAQVTFQGSSAASTADFRTKGGHFGPSLAGFSMQGRGGQVRFEGASGAGTATFINEGCQDTTPSLAFVGGTGGRTVFTDNSSAQQGTFHNHGATNIFVAGHPLGGATHFYNSSTAEDANITNHADATFVYAGMEAKTVFYDSSGAGTATIENLGAAVGTRLPGQTEFRGNSSAARSNIHNRAHPTPGGPAGRTIFYDSASAAEAAIHTYEGHSDHGRVEFRNQSKAGRAQIFVEHVPNVASNGGYVNFYDNSSAEQSRIYLRAGTCCAGGISFNNSATAGDAQILTEDNSGHITFQGNSTAGDPVNSPTPEKASISLGPGSLIGFFDQSKAEDAVITMAHGSQLQFSNNSSAGAAQIVAAGSSLNPWTGAGITFNTTSTVNDATITLGGGTVPFGSGATAAFIGGAHAGTAAITANGGTGGGGGAKITFDGGAQGDTARLIANAGSTVDFLSQRLYGNGSTSVGSIEGAGSYILRGSLLTTGALNTSTTVSGPISDGGAPNGRLTKVGAGTLTLAGSNTYTGLTTINAGTVSVTSSIAGSAVVNNGGTLNGTGTIGGTVTVNSGGVFAPGTSPGTITVGGLAMTSGGRLDFELGPTAYDRIVASGNASLAGILNVSLVAGFTPTAGSTFNILDWGTITGTFTSLTLPSLAGLSWNTSQLYTSGVLSIASASLPGDFNNNGVVDAADYVVWRKTDGTQAGYNLWRAHFGQTAGAGSSAARGVPSGSSASPAIPEPSSLLLLAVAFVLTVPTPTSLRSALRSKCRP